MSSAVHLTAGLFVMTGFGALALDLGFATLAREQVQVAADSAAIAAAISVAAGGDSATVLAAAQTWGQSNQVGSHGVVVDDADVRRGTWTGAAFADDPAGDDVWVRAHTAGIPNFLSRVFGRGGLDTQAAAIARVSPPFVCAIVGIDASSVHGNPDVSGYDSTIDLVPANAFDDAAAICSNASVPVNGSSFVDGSVRPGIGGEVTGTGEVTGSVDPMCTHLAFDSAVFPGGLKSWTLATRLNGNTTASLPPGKYRLNSNLTINGQAKLTITGPTEIWVDDQDVTINGGGIVNATGNPHNLKIYVRDGGAKVQTVKVNGSSAFHGLVYAPDSTVLIAGNADFYGGVVAADVDLAGNGAVYMDTSLMAEEYQCGIKLVR